MSKTKRLVPVFLIFCLLLPVLSASVLATHASTVAFPAVSAQSAILMLGDGETVVYEKDASHRLPMASTTKIMTALVALEQMDPSTLVRIPAEAVGTEGSSVYLVAGERLTLEQLLYALLLESANDAAVAIAITVSGSIEAFAKEMNARADALGLKNTHFTNPHGLDHEEHYTTAADLAKIACAALQNPSFLRIVSTRKSTIPHPDENTERLLVNHNKLLRLYDGCIGVKTGYTQRSGRCLVSAAERDGVTLVAVTLNAPSDWEDHTRMLDYGFSRYARRTLCTEGELVHQLPVVGGTDAYVILTNEDAYAVTLPKDVGAIDTRIECRAFEYAAVTEGECYATAVFLCDVNGDGKKEELARAPLTARYTVERQAPKKGLLAFLLRLFGF